jgi:flavin reductase (DIM6/NTAB) family NADH-FMN oxidoreductase RutF/rubredoxin
LENKTIEERKTVFDPKALYKIGYGLYIITSKEGDKSRARARNNGQIANAVMQVSAQPVIIAVGINKQNLTHQFITRSGHFAISVLEQETPFSLIQRFGFNSGRDLDKLAGVGYGWTAEKVPYITDHSLAYMAATTIRTADAGTHTLFLGEVTEASILKEGIPMTYDYYHRVLKKGVPSTAPTYQFTKKGEGVQSMDRYVCSVCGYIYDPEEGDPDNNIAPGTPFSELPAGWRCPVCGASKEKFEKEN